MRTLYPVYLETDDGFATFGVIVPDLPGCVSAGDSIEESIAMAGEAIHLHLEGILADGLPVPAPSPVSVHLRNKADWFENPGLWALVAVEFPGLEGAA